MAHDLESPPTSGHRRAGSPAPVNPFHMVIAELQGDLDELEPSEHPPAYVPSGEVDPGPDERAQPRDVAEAIRPRQEPVLAAPARRSGPGLPATAAVALLFGLAGGALAMNTLGNRGKGAAPDPRKPTAVIADATRRPAADPPSDEVRDLKAHADQLSRQIGVMTERLEKLAPPGPPADVSGLRRQVDALSQVVSTVAPLKDQMKTLDNRARELIAGLKTLRADVAALQTNVAKADKPEGPAPPAVKPEVVETKAETPAPAPAPVPVPTPAPPPPPPARRTAIAVPTPAPADEESPVERALAQGAELFRQGKYKEALSVFNKLELSQPDDARVWYYAALSHGFATNQWGGGTMLLVERGVEREQAGTPERTRIDAAFRDLSTASGKNWLQGYRDLVKVK